MAIATDFVYDGAVPSVIRFSVQVVCEVEPFGAFVYMFFVDIFGTKVVVVAAYGGKECVDAGFEAAYAVAEDGA